MIAHAANHLWQSTLFAAAIALAAGALRRNGAHVRYWLWFSASVKFFVPFALFVGLGAFAAAPAAAPRASSLAPQSVTIAVDRVAQPFAFDTPAGLTTPNAAREWITIAAVVLWVLGSAAIAFIRVRDWRRVRRAVRASVPIDI